MLAQDMPGGATVARRKNRKALLTLLREVRTEADLTQVEMARSLGVPQSFVSKYESGERRLDLLELQQVCQALGITLEGFVKRFEKTANRMKDSEIS
jgi:transcriptional regulator with XRE-family HTH domain